LRGGVVSWRNAGGNGEDVRGYDAYAEGEAPPEPHRVLEPLEIDRQSAQAELMRKNVLLP